MPKSRITSASAISKIQAGEEQWKILRGLAIYRLFLVVLLLMLIATKTAPGFLSQLNPQQVMPTAAICAAGAIALYFILNARLGGFFLQTGIQFLADLTSVLLLLYVSGGISSGVGLLLIAPTVGYALVLPTRLAILIGAISTLALFSEELYRQLKVGFDSGVFTQTGFLGAILLATALSTNKLAIRARRSEARAERFGSQLIDLTRINDTIVEHMRTGVIVVDNHRQIRLINQTAQQLLGVKRNLTNDALGEVSIELDQALTLWKRQRPPMQDIITIKTKQVLPRFREIATATAGISSNQSHIILLENVERVREEAQRIKLAALGRLSAGIAHEIRNPLAAISSAGELLGEDFTENVEASKLLDVINRQTRRIDKIVNDVLALSRPSEPASGEVELSTWMPQAVEQYQETHPGKVRIISFDGPPVIVRFSGAHLQQVLFNLWNNAFEHGGEDLTVYAKWTVDDARQVQLKVSDYGAGIPEQIRETLFEPFFTTATNGTGLGLYLAREMCENNNARLELYTEDPEGTHFLIRFSRPVEGV